MRRTFGVTSALVLLAVSSTAQASDEATAQALFAAARDAMKAGEYAKACPMLEESLRLVPGDGTKFNLADCYEKTGRTASAWAAFRDVAASSKLAGQKERESTASARAAALDASLCRLSIDVSGQSPPPTVLRDGEKVGPGQWGIAIPVDPGTHLVEARSEGKKVWKSEVVLGTCPGARSVSVPVLEVEIGSPPVPPDRRPDTRARPREVWRPAAIVTSLGLGVVVTGFGTYFGIRAWSLRNESNDGHCTGNTCDDVGRSLRSDSLSAGTTSTVTFIAGGVLLALGAVLWLTEPKSP